MELLKNSFFVRLINRLDISENSVLFKNFKTSFFFNVINKFFGFTQEFFSKISSNSIFLSKIDSILIALITILFISLIFASAKTIGIIAGLCFLIFLIKLAFKKDEKLDINVLDVPVFLYIALVLISVAFSSMFFPAIKGFAKVMVYFALYLVFFNTLRKQPSKSIYFMFIIAITAFSESLAGIYQNFTGVDALATWQDKSGLNPEQIMTRVYGSLKPYNPNLLGGYLTASISSVIGMFFIFAYRKNIFLSSFSFIACILVIMALVFTGSRGAYLGTVSTLTVFIIVSGHIIWHDFPRKTWLKKIWLYTVFAGIIIAIIIILSNPAFQHRIASILNFREDSSNSFRINVYISSIKMFLDNWLTGIGPGNEVFRLTYGLYMKTAFDALGAYSVPLEIAVESGIFALLAFLWIITAVFLKSVKIIINNYPVEQKIITACCLAGVIGIMTHGLVDTIFFRPQAQIIFWFLIAALGSCIYIKQNSFTK